MKKKNFEGTVLTLLFFVLPIFILAQNQSLNVDPADMKRLEGTWKGNLTYKDYTTGEQESIDVTIVGSAQDKKAGNRTWIMEFKYPGENGKGGKELLSVSGDGNEVSGKKVIENTRLPDGSWKIILEEKGNDGNNYRKATFHHIIIVNNKKLTITKMVKFDDGNEYFKRNEFAVSR